jgi:hypothetical protein
MGEMEGSVRELHYFETNAETGPTREAWEACREHSVCSSNDRTIQSREGTSRFAVAKTIFLIFCLQGVWAYRVPVAFTDNSRRG